MILLQEFRIELEVIKSHMFQQAMDLVYKNMHILQFKELHKDDNTPRNVHTRTTGDEWPSNYNEVRFYLFLCQIILMIITVVSRVSANGHSTITPDFQHFPRVKIEVGGPIVVCTRAHTRISVLPLEHQWTAGIEKCKKRKVLSRSRRDPSG